MEKKKAHISARILSRILMAPSPVTKSPALFRIQFIGYTSFYFLDSYQGEISSKSSWLSRLFIISDTPVSMLVVYIGNDGWWIFADSIPILLIFTDHHSFTLAFENILENWERFSLTAEEETTEVDVDRQAALATGQSLGFSLIGKLFAPRIISGDVMRRTFKSAWNIPNGLMVEKLGPNLFLFSLRSEADQTRVMSQEPWLFDKFLLALSKLIPMVKPTAMEFRFVLFWVHFCDLPVDLYNRSMAERLGNAIGHIQEYDNGGRGYGWKESLRVRITIDITRPLR